MYNSNLIRRPKKFKPLEDIIPCFQCILLAVCKGKPNINCVILEEYMQACFAYGANTLIVHNELARLFPNTVSFNGTIILA
jgi:hypothetical protein